MDGYAWLATEGECGVAKVYGDGSGRKRFYMISRLIILNGMCVLSVVAGDTATTSKYVSPAVTIPLEKVSSVAFDKVAQFQNDLEVYYVEPSWVLPFFLSCTLDEFDQAWPLFIKIILEKPWSLVVVDQKNYSEKEYRELLIAHCVHYDQFLKDLVVDIKSQKIFLTGNQVNAVTKQPGMLTIFQYWQAKRKTDHHHFYAFYFDRVAALYVQAVSDAFLQIDSVDYVTFYKKAVGYLESMYYLFFRLEGGMYDARYAQHGKRYYEVLTVLKNQRKALKESGL